MSSVAFSVSPPASWSAATIDSRGCAENISLISLILSWFDERRDLPPPAAGAGLLALGDEPAPPNDDIESLTVKCFLIESTSSASDGNAFCVCSSR